MLTMGVHRLVLVAPRKFPDADAVAMASGATAVLDAAQVVAGLDDALAGCVLAVGLSARPREFAGRVLPIRAAALEACEQRGRRRRRVRLRHRDVRPVER